MKVITVNTWTELLDELFNQAWNPTIGRFRSHEAYRGLSDTNYHLFPTLTRMGGDYERLERHLIRNFRKYAHASIVEKDSIWHWLSQAQHHGLPTRLMDWTYSPFVALHFATANLDKFETDGAIWAVDYVEVHELLPEPLITQLKKEGANVFTVEMLSETLSSLESLDSLSNSDYALFFEPPSIDDRIVNQHAFFSIIPSASTPMDTIIEEFPKIGRKIVIPAHLKWEIRDKLDQGNITERVLFPGLDGLSSWLKRHYSPKAGCEQPLEHA